MKSSTNRALVAKKQSTSFAQVANNLLNLLQGYSKSIRLLLVMFLTLTVSAEVWGALSSPYECLFKTTSTLTNNQVTTGDVTWTLTTVTGKGSPTTTFGNTNGQSAIKLGSGKNNYYSKMTLKTSAFSAYNVSKVVLYISSNNGGKKTITVKQRDTQIGTVNQSFTSTTWVTNCTLNATKGSGGDLSIEISSDATATFIHSITVTYETAAPTTYTVTLNPNYPEGKTGVFKDKSNKTINGNLVLSYPSGTASMQITSLYNSLTLDGYDFGGWYNAKGINPGDVSGSSCTYTGNITGDKTYYAKWTQKVYTVTATSNNNNYGTVSVSGTTITASPKTGYTYANPAYTVTSGTAIVTQNGNTFTVTPSTNCTIRINFEAKPKYTVNWYVNGSKKHSQTEVQGTALTGIPVPTTLDCDGEREFVGWTTQPSYEHATNAPTDLITNTTGLTMPENGANYYAVFATATGGGDTSKQYSFNITPSDFNTTSYAANNNEKTSTAKASDGSTLSVKWTSNQVMNQSSVMQWQKDKGYIFNSTDLGTIKSVEITKTDGTFTTYYGTSEQPSSGTTVGNGYFKIKVGSATGKTSKVTITFTKTTPGAQTTTYSDYITSCTTPTVNCSLLKFTANITENYTVTYTQNATATALTVAAKYDNSSTGVTYQWYSNTTNSNTNGTLITNATSASYKPSTTEVGTTYYYCEATYDECTINSNVATVTITAPVPTFTVTFDSDGGSDVTTQTIEKGKTATKPDDPTKEGHTFVGWYNGDTKFDFDTQITGNITLKAKWTINQHTVTLNPNYPNGKTGTFKDAGGNTVNGNLVLTYDYNTASMSLTDLYQSIELEGYQFNGWYSATSGGSKWTSTGIITRDVTVYAQWSKLYTITLSENGTTTTPTTQTSTSYTLPVELSAGSCLDDTKELVGWSTVAIPNPGDKPTSKFYELGATVTLTADQTTFYAVFATAEGSQNVFKRMQTLDELNNASRIAIINAYSSSAYILNTSLASAATAPKESSGKITVTEGQYWTLEKSNSYWKFKNSDNKYLTTNTIPTSSSKSGSVQLSTSGNNEWVIANNTYTSNGTPVFTIYNASSKNAGLEYSNGWILYYSTDFNTSWFTLKLYIPDVSYSEYTTTCVKLPDPVLSFATEPANPIEFTDAVCGGNSSKQSVTVVGENLRDVVNVSVTGPYKIARTSSTALKDFTTSLTLDKTAAGAIHSIYIISTPPAQSTEATTGTLTFTTTKGNTLTVNLSTPTVTCTQYTLTLVDRGVSTEQPTKYYAGETIDEAPADPEGVCTDPIHYVFDGWAEATVAAGATTYAKVTFPHTVTGNTKFYAVYRYVSDGGEPSNDFIKVTKEKDDWTGDYVIVDEDAEKAIGNAYQNTNTLKAIDVTITDNKVVSPSNDIIWQIRKHGENYTMYNASANKYAYIAEADAKGAGLSATTTNTTQDMQIVFNNGTAKVSGVDIYRCFYYYGTNTEWRTYATGSYNTGALYCRSLESYLYTTSPICGPHLEITAGDEIYVTGGNAGAARDLVMASQKVSYQATRLKTQDGSPAGTAPDVKVATNGITKGGVVTTEVKVTFENTVKELQPDDTYTITGDIVVTYEADANNMKEDIQVQLAVDYPANADAHDNFTVHARSLPTEFVIVAKQGDKWYALNADMSSSKAQPANGQVKLNDLDNPTEATYAPCNAIYTFEAMPQGAEDRKSVRFIGMENKYLWSASEGNTGIQNNSKNPTADALAYNWKLYTEDNITYRFGNAQNTRMLGLHSTNVAFGMYANGASVVQDIRILPYVQKCLYNYAPSNLKVTVLKGTYVTLTWDAVAGATKYQYSTDATNWTDCGTEPTATINGLEGGTRYIYYIRAHHEDAGVSQECIDYAEITFTTADCDDVPTDITYTADLNSITVSWTAAASTATIKLFMDEEGAHMAGSYPSVKSPYTISGGLNPNTTYYIQILAGGTCASQIIPVKTEDVKVDVVEWKIDSIVVDINTNENISVTLENEVSYGSGLGSLAEDLFFSKYFEGSGSLKMIAIYNGTGKDVNLSEYRIDRGGNGDATNISKTYDLSQLGVIKQGQEIIFYSWPLTSEDSYSCSQSFLDSKEKESGLDANPRWILCDAKTHSGIEFEAMDFSGDDPLLFYKGNTLIDVFGVSTAAERPSNKEICSGRSDYCWSATEVSNMDYGKTTEDFPNGEIPYGVNVDDETITAYTARVIMFRKNTVVSGKNAVTKNTTTFATFADEWEARQVCRSGDDGDLTCAAYQELGTFDYSKYYTKFESMGDEIVFEENKRNPDGTVTIPITDLNKQSCRNIRIIIKDNNTKVISNQEYKVPIMITTTQGTDGQAFLALQENLATVEVDGNGTPTGNKTNLTLEQAKEICKTCDVVVRDNATLTKIADDAANDHPQVRNVYVYENSSLIVPNGTNYTINNLSLRRKEDAVASVNAYPEALKLPESAAAPISLDFRLSAESWHWFTLPYNCNINEVTWADGTPAQYNTDWYLMTYDGKKRAETQAGGCWKAYTGTTINAGDGFIIAINGNINNPAHTYELHFPMSKEVLAAEGIDKTVAVRAWGVETNIRPNHKGWNLVGNPYLAYYQRNNITKFEGLRLGQLTGPDLQTGYWEQTGDVPYVVVPVGAGWIAYEQVLASETDLLPFTAYFVQVGNDGKHDSSDELSISFDHTKLQLSATPMPASIVRRAPSEVNETEEPVIVGVALTNSLGESDKTSLVIADRFTNEYEMQADFFKWFGDYYNYYTKPVLYTIGADQGKRAFNALNEELAAQPISMGMYAAQAGNYTFSLNQQFDLSRVEEVWLYDATQSTYTNLMQSDYTFSTSKVNGAGRFSLSVKLAPKVATSIDNVTADKVWATTHTKQVIVNGLDSSMHLWLYDATGKLLYNEPTSNYQHTYSVPQTGTYFVSVMNGNQKQTIKVVVE